MSRFYHLYFRWGNAGGFAAKHDKETVDLKVDCSLFNVRFKFAHCDIRFTCYLHFMELSNKLTTIKKYTVIF